MEALAFGFELDRAIFLGFVIALSSTAIVLKLYDLLLRFGGSRRTAPDPPISRIRPRSAPFPR